MSKAFASASSPVPVGADFVVVVDLVVVSVLVVEVVDVSSFFLHARRTARTRRNAMSGLRWIMAAECSPLSVARNTLGGRWRLS
jgi:hypothetical protein